MYIYKYIYIYMSEDGHLLYIKRVNKNLLLLWKNELFQPYEKLKGLINQRDLFVFRFSFPFFFSFLKCLLRFHVA